MSTDKQKEDSPALAVATGSASGCTEAAKYWSRKRTLENALEALAGGLPDGWTVHLCVENGAAWVDIENAAGKKTPIHEDDGDLYDCLRMAELYALEHSPNGISTPPGK